MQWLRLLLIPRKRIASGKGTPSPFTSTTRQLQNENIPFLNCEGEGILTPLFNTNL
eukprot:m.91129 g.91129  ORF g.91129 m.91129 type:complete len:56 (+) comp26447_c0_seq2:52-219(+)